MDTYKVTTTHGTEWFILADDVESAAWEAERLAGGVNYLIDVSLYNPIDAYRNDKETVLS